MFKKYKVLGLIDGSAPYPVQYVYARGNADVVAAINPDYVTWNKVDHTQILWIQSTFSESVLSYVVGPTIL